MAASKKEIYIDAELDWSEKKLKEWQTYVDENPLHNLKSLYGTGVPKLNEENQKVERVGGVRWTIKDGIVYDAQALLADVRAMVKAQRIAAGLDPKIPMSVEQ